MRKHILILIALGEVEEAELLAVVGIKVSLPKIESQHILSFITFVKLLVVDLELPGATVGVGDFASCALSKSAFEP